MRAWRACAWLLPLAVAAFATSVLPWEDLTEGDWLYAVATRFALVDGHKVHYPTPTAELARLLEGRSDPAALRHLAEARLALGDRPGALETLERWAAAQEARSPEQGAQAWAETARWEAAHQEPAAAFKAAERALPALAQEDQRALCDARIAWAEAHPDLASAIALREAKARRFPDDLQALETWLRALEGAGRLVEADQGLAAAGALPPERRLLIRADLKADHGDAPGAFRILDAAVEAPQGPTFSRVYARRVDLGAPGAPGTWRATLEARYDAPALVRLCTYLAGASRSGQALDLLRQVERRYDPALDRTAQTLLARLYAELDAVPEAFRAALAAAHLGSQAEQTADLAGLARLALRAGGRPLAWGSYNDEAYRWVAAVDRTPGFWTGGLSFLLTGLPWQETLDHLESQSLPDRTFATARALTERLARQSPGDTALPALRLAIMTRHVEQGEGAQALALLPQLERGPLDVADQARRQALLAARQVSLPLAEELRLMKARMRFVAPDGARPTLASEGRITDDPAPWESPDASAWSRLYNLSRAPGYGKLLDEHLERLDQLDASHRASVDLVLSELDRLPDAEALWLSLASRLEAWNLDDGLGPRYQQALKRFQDPGLWDKAARWYARRSYQADLRQLAEDVTSRFRGSELFRRGGAQVKVPVPEQPPVAGGVRMVPWADWVRLKALERFPHSPRVFREAGRLVTPAQWQAGYDEAAEARKPATRVIVPERLLEERRWAILFADPGQREVWFQESMAKGTLQARLGALEARQERTPVEDQLLFEGWTRLSRFEEAVAPGERLCRAYPGDGALARNLLSLHRSLNGLETSHAGPARALVERTAPALEDPSPLWTELGELEEDRGRSGEAIRLWRNLLVRSGRDPARIQELATLLWDYHHDQEALDVVEAGRKALGRPRFCAFETGVLRENLRDLDGAVRDYLEATRPEDAGEGSGSWYEGDQRSLRRLAQLLARPRVYALVEGRIKALAPGRAEDERALQALFTLGAITTPDPGLDWDADTWIDFMDQPSDPLGRDQRQAAKEARRPREFDAIHRLGELLLDKAQAMVPQATGSGFLDFASGTVAARARDRWSQDRAVGFNALVLARRAQLAPDEETRLRLEMDRADYLAAQDRVQEADTLWATLAPRLDQLPEGSVKLKAESRHAAYLERAKGADQAAGAWRRVTARHPWSLGLLEDRLAFLDRAGLGEEARTLLEATVPRAGTGHRENLLEQLAQRALAGSDLKRARWAVEQLLAGPGLEDTRRLAAVHVLARISFREDPAWDALTLAKAQAPLLKPELQADLHYQLARAGDLERAGGPGLWIEALNRRTDSAWLASAARSTRRSGKGPELLAFFEKQRERSPRDVRWAVAVRDLKRAGHDVEGALEAARAAVTTRPELEALWRDAADLLVKAGRSREAADYLAGWNRPRPASEDVARWRSELYAQAGDGERALAVEQEALKALAREGTASPDEREQRRTRAAERLFHLGHPELAVRLYGPPLDVVRMARTSHQPVASQVRIALLLGQLPRFLEAYADYPDHLPEAGSTLATYGRPEHKEAVQAWVLRKLCPDQDGKAEAKALNLWWPFLEAAGLGPGVQAALAQRILATRPGPWQPDPPYPFVLAVGEGLIGPDPVPGQPARVACREPELARLWALDLARRDRAEDLLAFLAPHWQVLLAQVKGPAPVPQGVQRLDWASWLDDPAVLATWARAAAAHPGQVQALGEIMAERRLWDRFWALAARGWSANTLVALLPEGPRTAWFRFWTGGASQDPVLQARRAEVERVEQVLARLVQGVPGAAADPLVDKLLGPRTVGEVLGQDARWVWATFTPRRDPRGQVVEKGEDRVTGQGVDQGRLPGALWGERPGEAWYVLEALVRYRRGEASAGWLPLEAPGQDTRRTLLAMRLARALGDLPLAALLAETRPGPAQDPAWQAGRLELLAASHRGQEAADAFSAYVRSLQASLTETGYQDLDLLATRLGLPSPLTCLDPAHPVGPVFLAYLQDQQPRFAATLHTANPVDYRTALANRWQGKAGHLTRPQARLWLSELWATGSAGANPKVLARLGPVWLSALRWLDSVPVPARPGALASLDEALDPARARPTLLAQLTGPGAPDPNRLLAVRIHLARHETGEALALVDALVAELGSGEALTYTPFPTQADPEPPPGEAQEDGSQDPGYSSDPVDRMAVWLAPFQAAGQAGPVAARFLKVLAAQRQEGALTPSGWSFALRHTPAAELPALARDLEEAWFRGELATYGLGSILEGLAAALPSELPRWLLRWNEAHTYTQTRRRVALLEQADKPAAAARLLLEARSVEAWTAREETEAFDTWRRLGSAPDRPAPAYWTGAAAVWKGATPLGDRLKAHGHDVLAARAALRTPGPGDEATLARAGAILRTDRPWARDPEGDQTLLRLRAARGLLACSAAAARTTLGAVDAAALAGTLQDRRFKTADLDAALADLARIAARLGLDPERARALGVLQARKAPNLKALQAELAPAPTQADAFRLEDGKPAPIRPRDLTWTLLATVLNKEGAP